MSAIMATAFIIYNTSTDTARLGGLADISGNQLSE
ncbi:hypothetical protein CFN58_19825 [Pseudomonas avellanae]|uniref:Uncharacterized protein n=2 Tax=Pseudomonas syringae group TaxID=136849 RepID=A0A261WGD5_9PSED|nr:hypothetical protein CT122_30395 [Pseudomonas syringae pv. actinidiae]KCV00080.1 hypothetical protein A250_00380 [Pseudomonas syringae pv. actinidiae ICMP 9617]OZI85231.1 hypothetical protein CFN58_19825 [Pseudomonas avellanae]NVL58495.1 hypothetical protein [Pseudomonas syringae pv. actinidiae]PBK53664.1 hypothetical protein BUE60_12505 [Pseudomonas syringae pv. actinidiae]